ncbi:NADH-ubiquinone oxidoreductase-F iron-sulfur binding region domain-containing protein [Salsipaludibacter albus]|uniref:NADH-ubiquinone oxidoreductase-F iron-sulfur binding region domain-containing protein n=1 Tax=Salsipaludibacter albus TaxID=2849650 RepID=UPI001EE40844|nr:NADH-ubiquinone oxidoreductase-F iron-sulfur binding region domain-containing protein [Salsipaludibacter albus]MBY5160995.1 NADH-quinone oxidoreductase subunit F [Salsipaludibacter albus]
MALFDDVSRLLPNQPVTDLDDYVGAGGGAGLAELLEIDRDELVARVADSGLRGRGGAGFGTGTKWRSIIDTATAEDLAVALVVNAAEGEPGTYKDRALMRWNPFQVLEGALIARYAVGASRVFIGLKERATEARASMAGALAAAREAGWPGADVVELVAGPDEYLYGEETAMLEVVEGDLPMPRHVAPYINGLFTGTANPSLALVNNVETLANVPAIVARGPDWFRSQGTDDSPGTMVFTLSGDVESPGCWELPLGVPLDTLVTDIGGAVDPKLAISGISSALIPPDLFATPADFDAMADAGIGLGSAGFVVYDRSHCVVRIAATLSRFLSVESCGQCNACSLGTSEITALLERIDAGDGEPADLEELATRATKVTDLQRCALPTGEQLLVVSLLESFTEEVRDHLGTPCWSERDPMVPKITDVDLATGEVTFDPTYHRKREDWTYAPE